MSTALATAQAAALNEAEKLLVHLAGFMERHGLLIPELVVKTPRVEIRLSLKRLEPATGGVPSAEHP